MNLKLMIIVAMIVIALSTCWGGRFEVISPPGVVVKKTNAILENQKPINYQNTLAFFKLGSPLSLGDKFGVFELRPTGILIHPGQKTPTTISFDLGGRYKEIEFELYIAPLPADSVSLDEAGIVGVEFILNGKMQGRFEVSRKNKVNKDFDVTNIEKLVIKVDNGNGNPLFDWMMINIVSLK
jgi:hypothetical protein